MKKIKVLISSMAFLLVSNAYAVYTKDDAQNLISLVKQNSQGALCTKYGPLRAKSGDACKTAFNAALALGVCAGFADFAKSGCQSNAMTALKKIIPTAEQNALEAARAAIAASLNQNTGEKVCNNVGIFLPDIVKKCVFLVGASMPAPKPAAPPIPTPPPPTPAVAEKPVDTSTLAKNIGLMRQELDNVQGKNSSKFLELVNAIAQEVNALNNQMAGQKNPPLSSASDKLPNVAKTLADAFVKKDTLTSDAEINALGKALQDISTDLAANKKGLAVLLGNRELVRKELVRAIEVLEDLVDDAIASVSQK